MMILIDSSVWIDYFRSGKSEWDEKIDYLLEHDDIAINGVVHSELLTGTKSKQEFNNLNSILGGLRWLEMDKRFWDSVSRNGFTLRRNALTVPLTDIAIATHCAEHDLLLLHNDKHFRLIAPILNLREYSL